MKTFAVTYNYGPDTDLRMQIRDSHRAWLRELFAEQILLASGPMVDLDSALLIFRKESFDSLAKLLDQDPFELAGVIAEREILEWNPVISPWSQQ
ncbi:MAG: hypothetical protein RIR16_1081 [Actinomycetota bacterium]